MRFMLLMIPHVDKHAAPGVMPESIRRMTAYNRELQHAGVLLARDGLHPPSMGARIGFVDGRARVLEAHATEARLTLGGYWMIDVGSLPEAVEWARRCPAGPADVIDVRQVLEMADLPRDVRADAGPAS